MCGARARTNFPQNPNAPPQEASSFLSAPLMAKLHRCHLASLQAAQLTSPPAGSGAAAGSDPAAAAAAAQELDEDHIEQMIDELLDSGYSMELCSPSP